ncbi:MAG: TIGR01459 family HAD-type hydrolase [Devosiaceae bacterium]|nr:TIGR01459 family HAD-type hydrolase [Devosiaceae bacterium MH13]
MTTADRPIGRRVSGMASLMNGRTTVLSDIWGVLHNGLEAWPSAVDALSQARKAGHTVILISNAPRPAAPVRVQLTGLGVPLSAYDDIVTSGDVTRGLLQGTYRDAAVTHIGPPKDRPLVDGLDINFTGDEDADVCLCSGLLDDQTETPEDYRARLAPLAERGVPMICANPDKIVDVGGKLIYCAGALADLYEEMGGETIILGKPHAPIYREALRRAGDPDPASCLALGDSMRTDVRGAVEQGIGCLFLTAGIHAAEFGPSMAPSPQRVEAFLAQADYPVEAWMPRLAW